MEQIWWKGDSAKDYSLGLSVFGVLEILLGIFCFSLAMLLLIVVSTNGLHGMKPIHYGLSMGLLFYLTGWFIVMGLGSIKAQRWARALLMVGAWVSVFFGTLTLTLVLYILPEAYNLVLDSGWVSPSAALGILNFSITVMVLLLVVLPLASVVFYGLEGVKVTCERRNSSPCWTDRCPLPLLAMSFISILGSLSIIAGATTHYVVFLFGRLASGFLGALVIMLISLASGYIGWGAYTRRMHAWWGAYALVLLTSSSMMLTFAELDMAELYMHMGYASEQIETLQGFQPINPALLTFLSGVWGIMACAFLVWVRDCFCPEKDETEVKSHQQIKAEEEAAKPKEEPRARMRLD